MLSCERTSCPRSPLLPCTARRAKASPALHFAILKNPQETSLFLEQPSYWQKFARAQDEPFANKKAATEILLLHT